MIRKIMVPTSTSNNYYASSDVVIIMNFVKLQYYDLPHMT